MNSTPLVQGIVKLLELCPSEVASLRRELLISTRHLLASELKTKFLPHLNALFSEKLMVGNGWTANETLRSGRNRAHSHSLDCCVQWILMNYYA